MIFMYGTSIGAFRCLHADADNEMIPVWHKCMTKNKKAVISYLGLDVISAIDVENECCNNTVIL